MIGSISQAFSLDSLSDLCQKDAAQEATAMKSRLIAHVSHEFRTPLNAIMGYAEMLKEQARSTTREVAEQDLDHILLTHHRVDKLRR